MRRLVLIALVACSDPPPPRPPAPPVPVQTPLIAPRTSCTDAAFGIDRSSKDLRAPEHEVVQPMRLRCQGDAWSQATIDCFAAIGEGDGDALDACIASLPVDRRVPTLSDIRGAQADQLAELGEVETNLGTVQVGIANCDKFVVAVRAMMRCESMEVDARIRLGTETVEAWTLPIHKLSIQDKAKLAAACNESLEALRRHAVDLACTL